MLLADMLHAVDDALNTQLVLLFGANQGQTVNTLFISLSTKEQNWFQYYLLFCTNKSLLKTKIIISLMHLGGFYRSGSVSESYS